MLLSICLLAEYVPTKRRTTILGTLQAGWSVGYLVATLLAGAILPEYGWRPLFLIVFGTCCTRYLYEIYYFQSQKVGSKNYE